MDLDYFNELWRTFIDSDTSLVYLKDENFRYVFVNKAFEELYGKKDSEIVGHDDFELIEHELAEEHRKTDYDVLDKKTISIDEVRWGSRVFQTTKFLVKLINGNYGIGAYARDVTEDYQSKRELENANSQLQEKQYALEEQNAIIEELNSQLEEENFKQRQQKEILHAIVDSLGAGVMTTDSDGAVLFVNKAWKDIFHYLEFGGGFYSEDAFYLKDTTSDSTEQILENILTGIKGSSEILNKLKSLLKDDHSRYNVDMEQIHPVKRFLNLYSNPCLIENNGSFGRVFVVRDISHQKEVDRLKMELISTVSHELRTPMSSIMGFSELVLTRNLPEERNKEYIEIINSEAKRLTNLINDFLDIQRMESGKQLFSKQSNSIEQIIEEARNIYQNFSSKHKITYHKPEREIPQVYCDRDKILQVMSNLISNAIKYSPDGGGIEITADIGEDNVKISISDHGLGIPEEVHGKLFTKFYRIHNDDRREIGGTGLGLAICKEIIQSHAGEIGFESSFGHGSTFWFRLPYIMSNIAGEIQGQEDNSPSAVCDGDVLLVEDDESMVKLIREVLKGDGLIIKSVSSGEDALQIINDNSYKLIILDIALSGRLNGWDVLKELKSNKKTSNIPIIISSVYENKNIASGGDFTEFLVKPFEPVQLLTLVKKVFDGKFSSKMMMNSDQELKGVIIDMLNKRGIAVRKIDHTGNVLLITLEEEEGPKNE